MLADWMVVIVMTKNKLGEKEGGKLGFFLQNIDGSLLLGTILVDGWNDNIINNLTDLTTRC